MSAEVLSSVRFECPPAHQHGVKSTCYVIHKCRCTPCRASQTVRARARRRAQLYGRYDSGLVPAGPVRDHMKFLQAQGMGWKRIAALSGVGNTAAESLLYGRKGSKSDPRHGEVLKQVSREKAEKILAVVPDLAAGALVPSLGTHRRVQALVARGWSMSKIGARLGVDSSNFTTMMGRSSVTSGFALKIAALFEEIWNVDPPHEEWRDLIAYNRSLSYAAARRWLAPLAWDDIDTDVEPPVPDAIGGPDEVLVELAVSGESVRLTPAERRLAVGQLWAKRWSDALIANRLGIADRTVLRDRQELGLVAFDQNELTDRVAA